MLDHRLITCLRTLSRKEMTRLADFAASPYHNKHQDTTQLINYLSQLFPDFNDRNCSREVLWKKLFPTQAHEQAKLAVLFTYAMRLTDQFLIAEQASQRPLETRQWLLEELRKRRLQPAYQRHLRKAQAALAKDPRRDSDHYRQAFRLFEEANQYFILEERRREDKNLEAKQQALDQFYVLEKLRDAVEMQVRRQILKGDYSARLLDALLQEVRENEADFRGAPAIQVYFHLYEMMAKPSLENYQVALEVFQQNEACFGNEEIGAIYNYLQNLCISRINRNEAAFLRENFRLYRAQLDRGLLSEDGYLVEWHYKNIVTTALRLGEVRWVKSFIEEYRAQLAPTSADNAYRFNLAAYYHKVGQYDQVLELLTQVEYSDLRYNLGAKALLLRTYYELDEYEALNALVESFRQYLHRNRLMADVRRGGYYHLFRFTRRAASIRASFGYTPQSKTKQAIERLRREMDKAEAIFNRSWLEEKLDALMF